MSQRDPRAVYDGFQTLEGGMDSGNVPSLISKNQYSYGSNIIHRGGFVATRPAWLRHSLIFNTQDDEVTFEGGRWQGGFGYESRDGHGELLCSISGHLFRIRVDDFYQVDDISIDPDRTDLPKAWFVQAEEFCIRQDGQAAALIYDGASVRRVNPSSNPKEIPVGRMMEYSMGRIWTVLPDRMSFVAGDIVGGSSGISVYNNRDAVLKSTENSFLNGGGAFGIPASAGFINGLKAIANLDSSLGQGPLQIACDRAIFSVNAPFDRTSWQNLQYPIQTVSLLGNGYTSHEGMVLVNGDFWGRSGDGFRSFQIARRDQGSWVNTPMSTEANRILRDDDTQLLGYNSGVLFDNRFISTASPHRKWGRGFPHRGLVALDFNSVSGISKRSAPSYDGLYTGRDILQVVPLKDRVFMFTLADGEVIELWELSRSNVFDAGVTPISCTLETRSLYPDTGFNLKEIQYADLWVDDIIGDVDYTLEYRPDEDQCWKPWHSARVSAKYQTCGTTNCVTPSNWQPQYRTRIRFPKPDRDCDTLTNKPTRQCYEAQARLSWTGHWRVLKFRLCAHDLPEIPRGACTEDESTDTVGESCCVDPYQYQSI